MKKVKEDKYEFPVVGNLAECGKCGRKILVERALIGVNHTMSTIATCWECLKPETQKEAREIYQLSSKKER